MIFHFTIEKFGYALREARGAPWCLLTRSKEGWFAGMIEPGFPSNGPFKSQVTAGRHAVSMCQRRGIVPANASIEVPFKRGRK